MTSQILTAKVEMDDHGQYTMTVVDYLNDMTFCEQMPDHMVSMLPIMLEQLRRQLK